MREVMLDVALQPVKQDGVAPDLPASLHQRQVAGGMIRQRCLQAIPKKKTVNVGNPTVANMSPLRLVA